MSLEHVEFLFTLPDIVDFYLRVSTSGQEPVTIDWVPSHLRHCVVVRLNGVDSLATGAWVKDLDV